VIALRVTARRLCVGLAVSAALLTSACAAGQQAQTADERPTIDGTNVTVGEVKLQALAVIAPTSPKGYPAGSNVDLRVTIVNTATSADTLTSITSPSVKSWGYFPHGVAVSATASVAGQRSLSLQPGRANAFGLPDATASLSLLGVTGPSGGTLFPAAEIKLTFTFAHSGTGTALVPVQISPNGYENAQTVPPLPSDSAGT
jgi:periplasmic copper chaperone A